MWAKEFWTGGNDFSAVWAIPVLQWAAAFHTIDSNGSWTRPLYPLQNEFCLLKRSALSRTSPGEGRTRTACLCVAVFRGKWLLKLHCHQQDSSMARGFTAPSVGRGLADSFFISPRGTHTQHLPVKAGTSSLHLLSKEMDSWTWCCSSEPFPPPGVQQDMGHGVGRGAGLQTCWGWRVTGWASALLRKVISSSASSAVAGQTALHWPHYMSTKRRESSRQPWDKGMLEARTVRWYLCCAYRCLV